MYGISLWYVACSYQTCTLVLGIHFVHEIILIIFLNTTHTLIFHFLSTLERIGTLNFNVCAILYQ